MDNNAYGHIRSGGAGFIEMPRGLIAVSGKEAIQFLDGLITNDMKTLEDGGKMLAAFPNAKGRLLAVVRVMRQGERFLFETEEATREAVFQNLFRFTFAGDFFVEDLSGQYRYFELFGLENAPAITVWLMAWQTESPETSGSLMFTTNSVSGYFASIDSADSFRNDLIQSSAVEIDVELYETLRIESGIPKYGIDMDETTIVPELGLDGMISYTKGCYIGQEIIARIHFRGHVAKQLTGLILSEPGSVATGSELADSDGKNAGRITSVTYSPKLENTVALAFIRFEHLAEEPELKTGGTSATVTSLPFIK
ncbi:MAG: YgfZ/GcvT domain-containing protein [Pyrinomonadaceae bacterium]